MSFRMKIEGLDGLTKGLEKEIARDVTAGVRRATEAFKADVREETAVAFSLSNRLPKAWRSYVYPAIGDSVDASGTVMIKNTAAAIIQSAIEGTVIVANRSKWLAIPTAEAGKFGLKANFNSIRQRGARTRVNPRDWERRTGLRLRFVPGKGGNAFLVADRAQLTRGLVSPYRGKGRGSKLYGPSGQTFVVFVLVRSVKMKRRLDLNAVAERTATKGVTMIGGGG